MVEREDRGFLLPRTRQERIAARRNRSSMCSGEELTPRDLLGFDPYPEEMGGSTNVAAS